VTGFAAASSETPITDESLATMQSTTPPPIPIAPANRNWWQRNWKWFVPMGCLGLVMLFATFVGLICVIVFSAMKSSDVYKTALARAQGDPLVMDALGSPIKPGMLMSGSTNVNGASGQADLAIPIAGPKGKGTLYVVATKSAGRWNYSELVVELEKTKKRINLKSKPAPKTPETSE
jgi:Cytochrome oxidase complex assembly protein 1